MSQTRRKQLLIVMLMAFATFSAPAQERAARKLGEPIAVGILALGAESVYRELPTWTRFYARMRELGWHEGKNVRYLTRGTAGDVAMLDSAMRDFIKADVALVVTSGTLEALAAKRATNTIPIVMLHPTDPVELGLVTAYARPAGNITGQSARAPGIGAKWVELLSEIAPSAKRIAFGYGAGESPTTTAEVVEAAQKRGLVLIRIELPTTPDYDSWAAQARHSGADAAIVLHVPSVFPQARRKALAAALIKRRLPAICGISEYVDSGCLSSYNSVFADFYSGGAEYVDKILRGAKPGDLPIRQPTIYELTINRKTAKSLGLTIPQSILLRADRVIE